jgi:cysteine desulfurase family protein
MDNSELIYLDNAATSNYKPGPVLHAMIPFLTDYCANPSRGSHSLANRAARMVFETRERLLTFFHASDDSELIFTKNITESLNLVLKGLLKDEDHLVLSSMEHNSMMRPLKPLTDRGVSHTVVSCSHHNGLINIDDIERAITPDTKLIAINHASNVFGIVQPIAEIGALCRKHNLLLLVDTAQTAGSMEINMVELGIDLLAFTGHKGLQGPMGIGGLVINERVNAQQFEPLMCGGTGSHSEYESQPDFFPDALESGTPNLPGIAGLNAAVKWLQTTGIDNIQKKELKLCHRLIEGLQQIEGVTLFADDTEIERVSVLSIQLDGIDNADAEEFLSNYYGICLRIGLHCSPRAHKTMGTFPEGTLRLSIGYHTTKQQIEQTIHAFSQLMKSK